MADKKTALTFEEKITVAWAHHVQGVDQHVLAALMGVNQGRIAEACTAVRTAVQMPVTSINDLRKQYDLRARPLLPVGMTDG